MSGGSDEWLLEWFNGSLKSRDFLRNGFSCVSSDLPSGCLWDRACSGLGFVGMLGKAFVGLVSELDRDVVRGLISGGN